MVEVVDLTSPNAMFQSKRHSDRRCIALPNAMMQSKSKAALVRHRGQGWSSRCVFGLQRSKESPIAMVVSPQ